MSFREMLTDERGNLSAARTLLSIFLAFTGTLIVLDSVAWDVPDPAYVLLGSIGVGLLAWAAGPRVAEYLGPQMGAVASGIAQAIKRPRQPELLDNDPRFREDDEG